MKLSKSAQIIHGFALLHAVTAIVCRLIGVDDSLILTLMTMLMTVWLSLARGYSLEITAICIILVNVGGFILGKGGARLLNLVTVSTMTTSAIATFLTTEFLGWCIVLLTRLIHPEGTSESGKSSLRWVIVAFFAIIIFRFVYVEAFAQLYDTLEDFLEPFAKLMTNVPALLLLVCANIIYVRMMRKWKDKGTNVWKVTAFILFVLVVTVAVTFIAAYNVPFKPSGEVDLKELVGIFMITMILELTVYCITYLIDYASLASKARDEARVKAQEAQFQYIKLKQQVNPHFLFNSLNSLDYLVCEGQDESASAYIHKLSGIYRYMLSRGEEEMVRLSEEINFVDMYVDLVRLRFGSGLVLEKQMDEQQMNRFVVPCSVQLLIENAVKHNIVSEEEPLVVTLTTVDDRLVVRNPLRPKLTKSASGGHGLKYINDVYENLCGRKVKIEQTDTEYIVSLPLTDINGISTQTITL